MSLIDRPCRGCSHPTICRTHGCGAEEVRRNKAQPARVPLTGRELSRLIADAGADELAAVSGSALLRLIRAVERAHGITLDDEGGDHA